ncbi:DNA methyltransferase [Pseudanabaena sp. ABRG5-3]|uniref:DNA methyltransferase n=1 Tax=Pseudanabaena sp. ABRG5-3 TaxID=685565 RepID=UPI000DC73EE0|nr:DNA methyltransferase [Pseudanabaena sp. ABRG5-3]BBC26251.1 DNA methyltransferase [Pseudanabaena sp. ABRG5-3]
MPLSWNEIKQRAIAFSKEWENETSEKSESQSFWNEFFNVFGISRRRVGSFELPIKKADNKQGFIDLLWKGTILVEHKSRGKDLDKATQQAKDYFPNLKEHELPKYILVSDFQKFRLYDLDTDVNHEFELKDFVNHVHLFGFMAGYEKRVYKDEDPVNIEAAELMGKLHDRLKEIGYSGHDLEMYLVRLLFCMFADDTGIFNKGIFWEYIDLHTKEDGSDLAMHIASIFHVLNTPNDRRLKNLDENLAQFPYVNGKLFEEMVQPAAFDRDMREMLLKACGFDWGKISPAIFGSMFQAVMNQTERRNLGAHYTSEKNIQKLIKPLFLDDLYTEFEKAKGNRNRLNELNQKIANLHFLDPACGCGNFLIITYRELRDLEILILLELNKNGQLVTDVSSIIQVDVDQFAGIEYDEFAVRVAEVAMWLIDHQMNIKVSNEFGQYFVRLPLKKAAKIVHGNSLRIDWRSCSPPSKEGLGVVPKVSTTFSSFSVQGERLKTSPSPSFKGGGQELGEQVPYKAISNLSSKKEFRRELRNNATPAEVALWKALQGKQLDGFKFRRQHSIGNYILDFFCPSANLAIELDGGQHFTQEGREYDAVRDEFLWSVGITVLRYANNLIFENLEGVLEDVREHLRTSPTPLKGGEQEDKKESYSPPFKEEQGVVFDYILGNPPFVGKHLQSAEQKSDMEMIFAGVNGAGVLDYVCAWYLKAAQYLNSCSPPLKEGLGEVKCAFVSTSSISQGEQVGILWQELYNRYKIKIHFAHRTFSWSNEAKGNAAVHCVIIGFGVQDVENKRIFDYADIKGEPTEKRVRNINPYLAEGNDLVILKRTKPICNVPSMLAGNKAIDGGNLIFTDQEKEQFTKAEPLSAKYFKQFIGSDEFINGKSRWCLWLVDAQPQELKKMPLVMKRIENVRQIRLASPDKQARFLADYPTTFRDKHNPDSAIIVPLVSSENRKYVPFGFIDKNIVPSNLCSFIADSSLYLFGVLTSEMHMTWVRYVCGRLESRFRYSNTIVYNNYPFPENVSDKQKQKVEDAARVVLAVREKYTSPSPSFQGGEQETDQGDLIEGENPKGIKESYSPPLKEGQGVVRSSLADLYDPLTMPPNLVKAHQSLDKAVDLCYRPQPFVSELNRIEYLFSLYEALSAPLLKVEKKKRVKKKE